MNNNKNSSINSLKIFKDNRLVNFFQNTEPTLNYVSLLLTSILLSVISFFTTYYGFELITEEKIASFGLAFAIQISLFWTARKLGRIGFGWKELFIFVVSAIMSVSFSYGFLMERINLRIDTERDLNSAVNASIDSLRKVITITKDVETLCQNSYDRWKRMETVELNIGSSTSKKTDKGKGPISTLYKTFASNDSMNILEIKKMRAGLESDYQNLDSLRLLSRDRMRNSEIIAKELLSVLDGVKVIYRPSTLDGALVNIKEEEDIIYNRFFQSPKDSSMIKNFEKFSNIIYPSQIPKLGLDNPKQTFLSSPIDRFSTYISNLWNLLSTRKMSVIIAFILALGLDLMVLICSLITLYIVPLKIVSNQKVIIESLINSKHLVNHYPELIKHLGKIDGKFIIDENIKNIPYAERIALFSLIEKNKIKQIHINHMLHRLFKSSNTNGGYNERRYALSPDLLDYFISSAYRTQVKQYLKDYLSKYSKNLKFNKQNVLKNGRLFIKENELDSDNTQKILIADLIAKGFIIPKNRFIFFHEGYELTEELIECLLEN